MIPVSKIFSDKFPWNLEYFPAKNSPNRHFFVTNVNKQRVPPKIEPPHWIPITITGEETDFLLKISRPHYLLFCCHFKICKFSAKNELFVFMFSDGRNFNFVRNTAYEDEYNGMAKCTFWPISINSDFPFKSYSVFGPFCHPRSGQRRLHDRVTSRQLSRRRVTTSARAIISTLDS